MKENPEKMERPRPWPEPPVVKMDEFQQELDRCIQQCPIDTSGAGAPFWTIRITPSFAYELREFLDHAILSKVLD